MGKHLELKNIITNFEDTEALVSQLSKGEYVIADFPDNVNVELHKFNHQISNPVNNNRIIIGIYNRIIQKLEDAIKLNPHILFTRIINKSNILAEHYNPKGELYYDSFFITHPDSILTLAQIMWHVLDSTKHKKALRTVWVEMHKKQEDIHFWKHFIRREVNYSTSTYILSLSVNKKIPLGSEIFKLLLEKTLSSQIGSMKARCKALEYFIQNDSDECAVEFITEKKHKRKYKETGNNILNLLLSDMTVANSIHVMSLLHLITIKLPQAKQSISDALHGESTPELMYHIHWVSITKDRALQAWIEREMDIAFEDVNKKDGVIPYTPYHIFNSNLDIFDFIIERYYNNKTPKHMISSALAQNEPRALEHLLKKFDLPAELKLDPDLLRTTSSVVKEITAIIIERHLDNYFNMMNINEFIRQYSRATKGFKFILDHLLARGLYTSETDLTESLNNIKGKGQLRVLLKITNKTPMDALALPISDKMKKWCMENM